MSSEVVGSGPSLRRWRPRELSTEPTGLLAWLPITPSLAKTHPQVFHPLGRGELVGLFAGERVACHAATREIEFVAHTDRSRLSLVGAISTASWARGQGLASELVRLLSESAMAAGCDGLVVTSSDEVLDAELLLEPMPSAAEIVVRAPLGYLAPGIRPAQASDVAAIHGLHANKPSRVERDFHDLALALTSEPMMTMVLSQGGEIVSYACHGKGLDLAGIWHECGGSDEDVATLIQGSMAILGQEHATVLLPTYRAAVVRALHKHTHSTGERAGLYGRAWSGAAQSFAIEGLDLL